MRAGSRAGVTHCRVNANDKPAYPLVRLSRAVVFCFLLFVGPGDTSRAHLSRAFPSKVRKFGVFDTFQSRRVEAPRIL